MKPGELLKITLILLLFLGASGAGLYWFIAALIDKLNSVSSDLAKAAIAGGVTVVIAIATVVVGKLWEQRIKNHQNILEKKIPIYEEQIAALFKVLFLTKQGEDPEQHAKEILKAFMHFTEKLLIWGGSEVIQSWQEFRAQGAAQPPDGQKSLALLERFIRTLRKEIGNENTPLKEGDLLRLFINDYDPEQIAVAARETQANNAK